MNTVTTARIARDAAATNLRRVNGHAFGPRSTGRQIAAAKDAYDKAQAAVEAAEADQLATLTARAAKHVPGAIALEDETPEHTLNRWAWIDLNAA